ncbi:MAG: hypothetical protein IKE64_01125 [Thermoguttaceae bacterium]|nr:hypothetical protein [Thermoguttaceae bacterium]
MNFAQSENNRTLSIPERRCADILFEHFKVVPYIDSSLTKGIEFILSPQNASNEDVGIGDFGL